MSWAEQWYSNNRTIGTSLMEPLTAFVGGRVYLKGDVGATATFSRDSGLKGDMTVVLTGSDEDYGSGKGKIVYILPNTDYIVTDSNGLTTNVNLSNGELKTITLSGNIDPILENNSWETISLASNSGSASSLWEVGDEKDIVVGGETLTLVIMGFNHDTKVSGGTAGITFGLKNLMTSTRAMDGLNVNSNGFTGTTMYSWLQGTLYNSMSSDLQTVIQSVKKKTSSGNSSTTIETDTMKIFLFAEVEIIGYASISVSGEGNQYSYFTTQVNRKKKLSNGSGSATTWWTRSPINNSSYYFVTISDDGYIDSNTPDDVCGVCFGFCV